MKSIITLEKPLTRVALADWQGKVYELRQTCDTRRNDAFSLRSSARQLRNETDATTRWDLYHTNNRMRDRLIEITDWRDTFRDAVERIRREVSEMSREKELTEAEIEYLGLSFTVVQECLTQRDQRGGADLCTDEAEIELKHELSMLESLKTMLRQRCSAAWEQMNRLEEIRGKLEQDLQDKEDSVQIDSHLIGMDCGSNEISYKPDPLRIPTEMISYDTWLEHCNFLKLRAENELSSSGKLRESMYVPRERARMDLQGQNDATNFALRKRIYETHRIKNELEWQRLNAVSEADDQLIATLGIVIIARVSSGPPSLPEREGYSQLIFTAEYCEMVKDMEKLHREVETLEQAFLNKTNTQKLGESRLERRLGRPGAECCRDEPAFGLEAEVAQLRASRAALQAKIDLAKMISYDTWLEHCNFLKLRAENELSSSGKLRESMYVPRERARMDLQGQNDATNFALRKRIYETHRIKNELEWQRLNMVKDMEKLHREVETLEQAFLNKTNTQKLGESRLERRLGRPGAECCRDEPAFGLEAEVAQLRASRAALQAKIDLAKATYNGLEEQLCVIDRELHNKNHALETDLKCLGLRGRLVTGDRAPPSTQMDRNLQLTRMEETLPQETI